VLCALFFSLDSSCSSLDYIFHGQPCHSPLWQTSTDNFWYLHDCESRFLGSVKNNTQIVIASQGVRWAPSSAHLCPGFTTYSARSNQWSKGSRSRPIQDFRHFSTPPLTNIRFIGTELASLHFQGWQGISCLDGWLDWLS
jgi:hypothetical protein